MHKLGEATKKVDYEKEIDDKAVMDKIKAAKFKTLKQYPFYGEFILQMGIEETNDPKRITTMATNGIKIFYNKHFVDAMTPEETIFVFAHEVLHNVLKHLTRRGKRQADIWNSAGDYVINKMLVDAQVGKFPSIGGLYDEKYDNMTTDQVYQKIVDDAELSDKPNFDQHLGLGEMPDGSQDPDMDDLGDTPEDRQEAHDAMMDQTMQEALKKAMQGDGAGHVPAGIIRMIQDLTEPRVDWRQFISACATSQKKVDYSFKRPNRRMMQMGFILPSQSIEDHFEFDIAMDTSGSICPKMLEDFMGEIYGIAQQFKSFRISVMQYDTEPYGYQVFTEDTIEDILSYEIRGGGGTDFMAPFRYYKEHDIPVRTFINLTDGYPCGEWGDADYVEDELIFIIHDEYAINNKVKSPIGMTVYFDDFER